MSQQPKVTVLMTAYNSENWILEAIKSVLQQTYTNFELLVVDDSSTDNTVNIVRQIKDPRIRLIRNKVNLGCGGARQVGLMESRGEYIAVLDSDDVAFPFRLEKQVGFLDEHQNVALIGGGSEYIDKNGAIRKYPLILKKILLKWALLFRNPIIDTCVMYRKSAALEVGGYDSTLRISPDFRLFSDIAFLHDIAQLPEILCRFRRNYTSLTLSNHDLLVSTTIQVVKRNVKSLLGKDIVDPYAKGLAYKELNATVQPKEIYRVYEECLEAFIERDHWTLQEISALFSQVLIELQAYEDAFQVQRGQALGIAFRFGKAHFPRELFSPAVAKFILRSLTPYSLLKLKRRLVKKKNTGNQV